MNKRNVSKCEIASLEFLPEIIRLTLSHLPDSSIVSIMDGWMSLRQRFPKLRMIGARSIDSQGTTIATAYLCEYPGALGVLVGPWVDPKVEEAAVLNDCMPAGESQAANNRIGSQRTASTLKAEGVGVLKLLLEASAGWGIEMVQAIIHHDCEIGQKSTVDELSGLSARLIQQQEYLRAGGMQFLTTLIHEVLDLELNKDGIDPTSEHFLLANNTTWIQFKPDAISDWIAWIDSTYVDTIDCPELNGIRTTSKTLEGYGSIAFPSQPFSFLEDASIEAAKYDLNAGLEWWGVRNDFNEVAKDNSCNSSSDIAIVAGILLSQLSNENWELTYMGVSPSYRGRGLGNVCIAKAIERVIARGGKQLSLAMDIRNIHGGNLYKAFGFRSTSKMNAWIFSFDKTM